MKTHQAIDRRSLILAWAVAVTIDNDPQHAGLELARENCARWRANGPNRATEDWAEILRQPWSAVREILLEDSEEGRRRRRSTPFCGILSPQERWKIFEGFNENEARQENCDEPN